MDLIPLEFPGCFEIRPPVFRDERGSFVKPFQASAFAAAGLPVEYPERFYSQSRRGVVRGLHFQLPPAGQHKIVYCTSGRVLDVVVDLRAGSPTFGQAAAYELDSQQWNALFLPVGIAHGFAALEELTTMAYAVGAEYDPDRDTGIRWDTIDFTWPFREPVVSARDMALPALEEFASPFEYLRA